MNTELFIKVRDAVHREPRSLNMDSWEDGMAACGTTRCLAGHAIHQTTGQPLYGRDGHPHRSVVELAESLGIAPDEEGGADFPAIGAKLLGLSEAEAARAFFSPGERALQFIDLAAAGYEAEAVSILRH